MVSEVDVVTRALERVASQVIVAVTLDVVANLLRDPASGGTPVDTGWARANWIPRIGAPGSPGPQPKGREERAAAVPSQAGEQQTGLATVATRYRLALGPVFIVNPVPYILRLNAGHSPQAAPGFVERAIQKAVTQDLPRKRFRA